MISKMFFKDHCATFQSFFNALTQISPTRLGNVGVEYFGQHLTFGWVLREIFLDYNLYSEDSAVVRCSDCIVIWWMLTWPNDVRLDIKWISVFILIKHNV